MKKHFLALYALTLIIFACDASASTTAEKNTSTTQSRYQRVIPKESQHFLIPKDHPMRARLNKIFAKPGVLANVDSFEAAGFKILLTKRAAHTRTAHWRLARHPQIPGYLFKVYLDSETKNLDKDEGLLKLTDRCKGAENIRKLIKQKNLHHFVVPEKWLYRVPIDPQTAETQQPVILMVTNMNLASRDENRRAWRNVNKEQLDELYSILSHGYASTFLMGNIPYTKAGKFACLDTEVPKRTKVKYQKVKYFISKEMAPYWDRLTNHLINNR